jgi:hypothetical protein
VGSRRAQGLSRPAVALHWPHLRADPNLSKEGAKALEALIKTAYQQFRKK